MDHEYHVTESVAQAIPLDEEHVRVSTEMTTNSRLSYQLGLSYKLAIKIALKAIHPKDINIDKKNEADQ